MDGLAFGLAFTAGVLSVANPCALGMIPAYFALRAQAVDDRSVRAAVLTGSGALLVGFVGVFVVVALALALFGRLLLLSIPFVASAVGLALLAAGGWTLAGRRLHLWLPAVAVRGGAESVAAQFAFGATYALASLGCALPIFLAYAAIALGTREPLALAANVAAFAGGAGVSLLALVLLATAAQSALRGWPGSALLTRYGGGALFIAAGSYLLYVQLGWFVGYPFGLPTVTLPL